MSCDQVEMESVEECRVILDKVKKVQIELLFLFCVIAHMLY